MQPYLKIGCPNQAGFVGTALLKVFKQNNEFLGQTQVTCPASPPEPTTIKFITDAVSSHARKWTIEMTLTNNNPNGHTSSQVFNGEYFMNQPNTTTGKASVTVDGVTLGGGTGWA